MWIAGYWFSFSRELLYGLGFLLFLLAIVVVVIVAKRKRDRGPKFSASRIFKGKNLERAGKNKKDLDVNYDDMPIVGLKWQEDSKELSNLDYGDDDDEEGAVDDGYTVVEKAIQEKIQKFQADPPSKKQVLTPKKEEIKKATVASVKKDATGDKMDFFTTGKSAL